MKKQVKHDNVGKQLRQLIDSKGFKYQVQLAKICADECGENVGTWASFICHFIKGRVKLNPGTQRSHAIVMLRALQATQLEALQIIPDLDIDEMSDLGLVVDASATGSMFDDIHTRLKQLERLFQRYGISHQATSIPSNFCSACLNLKSSLYKLKSVCERNDSADIYELLEKFEKERLPINHLVAEKLKSSSDNTMDAFKKRINNYLHKMENASEALTKKGSDFLKQRSRIDTVILVDFSICWLSILERFRFEVRNRFPDLIILAAQGKILSPEDTKMWVIEAQKRGWAYKTWPCNDSLIKGRLNAMDEANERFVVAVGVEAVAQNGTALASQGIKVICRQAKSCKHATVALAVPTFKIHDFNASEYLGESWGTDQFGQFLTLDAVEPDSYNVIVTDHQPHWVKDKIDLQCCMSHWGSY